MSLSLDGFMEGVMRRNPNEPEFHQAVAEVAETLIPFINENPKYLKANILERLTEPDRAVLFRVTWVNEANEVKVNRGYRVQWSNAIGPYKGGLRFHETVNLSVLKFLAFEQTFKNSLTGLQMGGGKGGSDFNPKGKSDYEVMRFCHGFMIELRKHIGQYTDVPAGDIGVGAREIGFMFGQYKRLEREFTGVITGKGLEYGGSLIRSEATGYGCTYFMKHMLEHAGQGLEGKTAAVSGAGNVAQFAIEKITDLGGKVLTVSDSSGFVHDPDGIDAEKLQFIKELKNVKRGRISEFAKAYSCTYHEGKKPWNVKCDLAFPCATQNDISEEDAAALANNGCIAVSEGANMPTTPEGVEVFKEAGILYGPGKAANAGGVAVSGLEMSQNSLRIAWSREEVDERLQGIMKSIHDQCVQYGNGAGGPVEYKKGANIAGFIKVADAMLAQGIT